MPVGGSGNDTLIASGTGESFDGGGGSDTVDYRNSRQGVVADLNAGTVDRLLSIMPVGDSITYGVIDFANQEGGGYRTKLWQRFQTEGRLVDFVGSQSSGPSTLGDRDHNGFPGRTIDFIDSQDETLLAEATPNVVLLMIGTNDSATDPVATMTAELRALLQSLTANSPETRVFVASIPPTQSDARNQIVDQYNAAIPGIVAELAAAGRKVSYVDMTSLTKADISTPPADNGLHPTDAGYQKIADLWYAALQKANVFDAARDTLTSIENLTGSAFGDRLTGDGLANRLVGLGGGDELRGNGGDDTLDGGSGADLLLGGDGADLLLGGAGNDRLYGDAGEDRLEGGDGRDLLFGGDADDVLIGGAGDDELTGGVGNDVLMGGAGADRLLGEAGFDLASYADASAGVRADLLNAGTNTGDALGDRYSQIEGLVGSSFADVLLGNNGGNRLEGGAGNDQLFGLDGADTLLGGDGGDLLDGGARNDVLEGGAGDDTLVGGAGSDILRGGAGFDVGRYAGRRSDYAITQTAAFTYLIQDLRTDAPEGGDTLVDIERLIFADGAFDLAAPQPSNRAPVVAQPIADQAAAQGTAFAFTIPAGAFTDPDPGDGLTYAARRADGSSLPSWLAFDPATGRFSGTPFQGDVGDLGITVTATDPAGASASDTFVVTVAAAPSTGPGVTIIGTAGADLIDATRSVAGQPLPTARADSINGGDGDDTIDGLGGADTIVGGAGNDTVVYYAAAVALNGGSGRDVLVLRSSDAIDLGAADQSLGAPVLTGFDDVDGRSATVALTVTGNANAQHPAGDGSGRATPSLAGRATTSSGRSRDGTRSCSTPPSTPRPTWTASWTSRSSTTRSPSAGRVLRPAAGTLSQGAFALGRAAGRRTTGSSMTPGRGPCSTTRMGRAARRRSASPPSPQGCP
jgi:Ca2+-binding RTX toxin-like protein